jgi:hypothetical protein
MRLTSGQGGSASRLAKSVTVLGDLVQRSGMEQWELCVDVASDSTGHQQTCAAS